MEMNSSRLHTVSYLNLTNYSKPAIPVVTGFLVDSSTVANYLKVDNLSPDYSSVMIRWILPAKKILYIGATELENKKFIEKQKKMFDAKEHFGMSGFLEFTNYAAELLRNRYDLVIISMGYPKQEDLANELRKIDNNVSIICAGAFISQESKKIEKSYYPRFIILLNLRWLYRIFFEKTARKRIVEVFFSWIRFKASAAREGLHF